MSNDVITKIHASQSIKNGVARIQSPLGAGVSAITGVDAGNYSIDTYSSSLPATGTVEQKYGDRFDDYQFYTT